MHVRTTGETFEDHCNAHPNGEAYRKLREEAQRAAYLAKQQQILSQAASTFRSSQALPHPAPAQLPAAASQNRQAAEANPGQENTAAGQPEANAGQPTPDQATTGSRPLQESSNIPKRKGTTPSVMDMFRKHAATANAKKKIPLDDPANDRNLMHLGDIHLPFKVAPIEHAEPQKSTCPILKHRIC